MNELLMFEVNVKNLTGKGRRGPAQVWGSDYGTVQYSTVMCSTVQYSTVQHSTVQFHSWMCWDVWWVANVKGLEKEKGKNKPMFCLEGTTVCAYTLWLGKILDKSLQPSQNLNMPLQTFALFSFFFLLLFFGGGWEGGVG